MANQTVTSDTNLSSIIGGLDDGQNITINNGAVLTVDDGSLTKLIGQIAINDGEMVFDGAGTVEPLVFAGEDAEEININGAGILRTTRGWWHFPATSNGSANQSFDCSSYFANSILNADVFSGVWVETGRRINYDGGTGILPEVGDWVYKSNNWEYEHGRIVEVNGTVESGYVVVQFFTGNISNNDVIEVHTLQDNKGPDLQKSWRASANGADVLESDVWQEFANVRQNATNYLAQSGAGIAGFCFQQAHNSNSLLFGDGVNGFIPPNGARIRVPMVHFATSTTALIGSGTASWQAGAANKYQLETVNGGDCYLDGASLGSVHFEDNLGGVFSAKYCAANLGFGIYGALSRSLYEHCIIVPEIEGDTRSRVRSLPAIVDLPEGADIRDCLIYSMNDSGEISSGGAQTSIGVNFERHIAIGLGSLNECELLRIDGLTINDLVVIGTQAVFNTSVNGDVKYVKTQRNIDGTVGGNDQLYFVTSSSNIKVTGWEILRGSCPDDSKVSIVDSSRIEIRCFHFIDDKFDNEQLGSTQGEEFASLGGLTADNVFARCWIDRGSPNEFCLIAAGTSKNITVLNCSGEYSGEAEPDGINVSFRGLHAASGNLGSTTGLETDLTGTAGSNCNDFFESDTRGLITCSMCPGSSSIPIEIVSGNPKFTKDGDVDVSPGDQFIIEMPYFALGHTSFRDVAPTFAKATSGTADGNDLWGASSVQVEFQYDTGSGYNGAWLDIRVNSNRTSITNMVDGIKLKYRITCLTVNENLQAFAIYTDTSIADQIANLYPIDQTQLLISGIPASGNLTIFEDDNSDDQNLGVTLLSGSNISSGSFVYEHAKGGDNVVVQMIADGYEEINLLVNLSNNDQTLKLDPKIEENLS